MMSVHSASCLLLWCQYIQQSAFFPRVIQALLPGAVSRLRINAPRRKNLHPPDCSSAHTIDLHWLTLLPEVGRLLLHITMQSRVFWLSHCNIRCRCTVMAETLRLCVCIHWKKHTWAVVSKQHCDTACH